jgi:hypothetical protein
MSRILACGLACSLAVCACSGSGDHSTSNRDAAARPDVATVKDSAAHEKDASVRGDALTPILDASTLPDGALVFSGRLPACTWPADLTPDLPDADLAASIVSRTFLICGPCVTTPMGGCALGGSDSGTMLPGPNAAANGDTLCVMACAPDQYALTTVLPSDNPLRFDADIIDIPAPTGCGDTLPAATALIRHFGSSSAGPTRVTCCPCQ